MTNSNKRKICYVSYKSIPSTDLIHYSKALADNGYKVTILTRGEKGQKENEVINNVRIKRIFLPDVPEKRKSAIVYIKDVVDCLNKGNFSLVFLHAGCRYFALIKWLFRRICG